MGRRVGIEREQIIDVAVDLADAGGLQMVTLAGVAARLGIRSPSLYNHIDGLDHLLRLLSHRGAVALRDHLGAAARSHEGAGALRALCHAYREFAKTCPGLYAAAQRTVPESVDPELAAAMRSAVEVVAGPLRDLGLDEERLIDTIRAMRALLHGFVLLETQSGFGLNQDVDSSFEMAVELLVAGITE